MIELDLSIAVATLLALWCIHSAIYLLGDTKKLSHIPGVGFNDPLLSYLSAFHLTWDPPGFMQKASTTIPAGAKFIKVPTLSRWIVVPTHPEGYQDIARAPEQWLSVHKAIEENLQAKYTTMTATAEARDNIQIPPIKGQLTRLLDELVPEVHDEIKATFDDEFPSGEEEWCSFVALPSIIKMVARISNRVLVGQSLCRNPEYITGCINYALEVFSMAYIISAFPEPIRPFVNRIISPIPRRIRSMTTFLQPLLDERRTKKGDKGDDYQPQAIFLNWLADTAEQREKDDREVVLRTMLVNFGSIHTTSMTFTHALFSVLSHPQYIAPLREEIELCIQEDGWTKPAIDRMRLLDSFLKESQRFDLMTILIGNRLAVEDCTISGTVIPKGTMVAANMVDAHFHPSMWGETADEFDPYRFIKLEEETGKVIKLPTSTLYTMTFGYGRHACPGRFFAGQEMKLLMAYFLHHYDLKLETKHGERPNNFWFGMGNVPNRSAKVLMRKRKEV